MRCKLTRTVCFNMSVNLFFRMMHALFFRMMYVPWTPLLNVILYISNSCRTPRSLGCQEKNILFSMAGKSQEKSWKIKKFDIIFNCGQGNLGNFFVTFTFLKVLFSLICIYISVVLKFIHEYISIQFIGICVNKVQSYIIQATTEILKYCSNVKKL